VKQSTLTTLPDPVALQRKAQTLAVLDAIMSPDWQYRYYSFNSKWAKDEMMASMTDGCGDNFFILFNPHGAILKGFDHESFMSPWARDDRSLWLGMFTSVPSQFSEFLTEPAFDIPNTTFCGWRLHTESTWQSGVSDFPDGDEGADGSEELLSIFVGGAETYRKFAQDYYEKELPLKQLELVYDYQLLSEGLVKQLNPHTSLLELEKDLEEIADPRQLNADR
jgi:hypothetical protein